MTDDKLLRELGAKWRSQTVDIGRIQAMVERRMRRTRQMLIARSAATIVVVAAMLYFLALAFHGDRPLFALAGIVLLVASPLMVLEALATARALQVNASNTAEEVLCGAIAQAEKTKRLLWGARASSILLAISASGLIVLNMAGLATTEELLIFAPFWGLAALAGWFWQGHRAVQLDGEIARCKELLRQLGEPRHNTIGIAGSEEVSNLPKDPVD